MSSVGGWTTFSSNLTKESEEIFEEVFKNFVGVRYSPLAFATQVVSGTNYSFFCNAKGVYPGAMNQAAMVYIYQPIKGDPHITEIKMVNPQNS